MKMKVFFDGLEPGVYAGTIVVDTDGNMTFESGEPMGYEQCGPVSVSMPASLYAKRETEYGDKPVIDPKWPDDKGLAVGNGTVVRHEYFVHRQALTQIALHLCEYPGELTDRMVNAIYSVIDYINRFNNYAVDLETRVSEAKNTILDAADAINDCEAANAGLVNAFVRSNEDLDKATRQVRLAEKELNDRQACLDATAKRCHKFEQDFYAVESNRDYWKGVAKERADEVTKLQLINAELQKDVVLWRAREDDTSRNGRESIEDLTARLKHANEMINERNAALHAIRKVLDTSPQSPQKGAPAPRNQDTDVTSASLLRPATMPPGFA